MRTIQRDIIGAFIFSNDGYILLGKNAKGGVYEDYMTIPGGGIEEGETHVQALAREVMEEVGVDISAAEVSLISDDLTGESEKTLRKTGERVLVQMKFNDYRIDLPAAASAIDIRLEDDFGEAYWIKLNDLQDKNFTPGVRTELIRMGYLKPL